MIWQLFFIGQLITHAYVVLAVFHVQLVLFVAGVGQDQAARL